MDKVTEIIEEIKSICIGADSPDAQINGLKNPKDELYNCRKDLSAISDLIEELELCLEEEAISVSDNEYIEERR